MRVVSHVKNACVVTGRIVGRVSIYERITHIMIMSYVYGLLHILGKTPRQCPENWYIGFRLTISLWLYISEYFIRCICNVLIEYLKAFQIFFYSNMAWRNMNINMSPNRFQWSRRTWWLFCMKYVQFDVLPQYRKSHKYNLTFNSHMIETKASWTLGVRKAISSVKQMVACKILHFALYNVSETFLIQIYLKSD